MAYINVDVPEKVYAKAYRVHKGAYQQNFDIRQMFPSVDYTQLTNQDFIASYVSDDTKNWGWTQTGDSSKTWSIKPNSLTLSVSYTPSTGALSVTRSTSKATVTGEFSSSNWNNLQIEVIMIVDGEREDYAD